MSRADNLLASLKEAGINVVEEPGWKTRGNMWRGPLLIPRFKPEGVMQHHTAPPNPYPIKRLYDDGRIRCNMATHEDGTLYLIAYWACNYSSGPGSKVVLKQNVRKETPPGANAKARGLPDNYGGNRHFWNYENSHPGDRSNIPLGQFTTIIKSNIVVNRHFGLNYKRIISHAEHTYRKIDPRWNGSNRIAIEQIRTAVKEGEGMATGPNGEPNWDAVAKWAQNSWTWGWQNSILSDSSDPDDVMDKQQLMVHMNRYQDTFDPGEGV